MSAKGYIQVHAFTSNAQLPLENVAITITDAAGNALAMRLTDDSGRIDAIEIPVPDLSESLSPDPDEKPYTPLYLFARLDNYTQIEVENIQVFADTITDQNLELIPLSELPGQWDQTEIFRIPSQNL